MSRWEHNPKRIALYKCFWVRRDMSLRRKCVSTFSKNHRDHKWLPGSCQPRSLGPYYPRLLCSFLIAFHGFKQLIERPQQFLIRQLHTGRWRIHIVWDGPHTLSLLLTFNRARRDVLDR